MRINLHNHTTHSDGRFSAYEIIHAGQAAKLEGIGISDHFFTTKVFHLTNFSSYLRGPWQKYLSEANLVRKQSFGLLKVWYGIEIDSCFSRIGVGLNDLPWEDLNGLDYILVEYVGEKRHGGLPLSELIRMRKFCKIPMILAHPCVQSLEESFPLGILVEIMQRHQISLEITAGTRNPWVWSERDVTPLRRIRLTIGTDTHERIEDVGAIDKALKFLEKNNLLDRLSDPSDLQEMGSIL